jgi:hypothetical protein
MDYAALRTIDGCEGLGDWLWAVAMAFAAVLLGAGLVVDQTPGASVSRCPVAAERLIASKSRCRLTA